MAPFDRSYTTFYWSAIVNITLSCTVFELYDVQWPWWQWRNLEIWVRGYSRSFKLVPFESLGAVFYSPSIVTTALFCIISEIKRDISRKSWFFHNPLHSTPPLGRSPSEYCHDVWYGKTELCGYPTVEKNLKTCLFVLTECTNVTNGQTDRQTDGQTPHDG